jgi:hypothetical protein
MIFMEDFWDNFGSVLYEPFQSSISPFGGLWFCTPSSVAINNYTAYNFSYGEFAGLDSVLLSAHAFDLRNSVLNQSNDGSIFSLLWPSSNYYFDITTGNSWSMDQNYLLQSIMWGYGGKNALVQVVSDFSGVYSESSGYTFEALERSNNNNLLLVNVTVYHLAPGVNVGGHEILNYEYDNTFSLLLSITLKQQGGLQKWTFTYDSNNRWTSMSSREGLIVQLAYSDQGISSMTFPKQGVEPPINTVMDFYY